MTNEEKLEKVKETAIAFGAKIILKGALSVIRILNMYNILERDVIDVTSDNMLTTMSEDLFEKLFQLFNDWGYQFVAGEPEEDGEFYYFDFDETINT